jgi:hypothetical protein
MPETITLHVPLRLQQRGGRKRVVTPDGRPISPAPQIDNALVKALARAHRWQRMLESGEYASLTELAKAEKINRSYLSRVLRLTLLAPEIVEAIMGGQQGPEITLDRLMQPFPGEWERQRCIESSSQRFHSDAWNP